MNPIELIACIVAGAVGLIFAVGIFLEAGSDQSEGHNENERYKNPKK